MCLHVYVGHAVIGSASVSVEPGQIAIYLQDPPAPPQPGTQRTQEEQARMTEWQIDGAIALVHAWRSASPPRSDTTWIRMLMGMISEVDDVREEVIAAKWELYCDAQGAPAQGTPGTSGAADAAGAAGEDSDAVATCSDAVPDTPSNGDSERTGSEVTGGEGGGKRTEPRKRHRDTGAASGADQGGGEEGAAAGTACDTQPGSGTGVRTSRYPIRKKQ